MVDGMEGTCGRCGATIVLRLEVKETVGGMDPKEARIKHPEWFDDYEAPLL